MIQYDKNFDDDSILPFAIHPQTDSARGQKQFSHNLIANAYIITEYSLLKNCNHRQFKHRIKYKQMK